MVREGEQMIRFPVRARAYAGGPSPLALRGDAHYPGSSELDAPPAPAAFAVLGYVLAFLVPVFNITRLFGFRCLPAPVCILKVKRGYLAFCVHIPTNV